MWRRIRPFLYSRRNIVGSLLALGGLGLFFTGFIGGLLWVPIVAGLYAIGVLVVPGEPSLALRLDASQDSAQIRADLDQLLASIQSRVADDVYARVVAIRDSILATIAAEGPDVVGVGDKNVYLIRQTALDYLPAALSAYLALPRVYAEQRIVANGQTSHGILIAQLDLMNSKMKEAADDITRNDSDRLLANGRFLAEKFAPNSLDLGNVQAATDAPDGTDATASDSLALPAAAVKTPAGARPVAAKVEEDERESVH